MPASSSPVRARSRPARAGLAALLLLSAPTAAQQEPRPGPQGQRRAVFPAGRPAPQQTPPTRLTPGTQGLGDVAPQRFIPPSIRAFLGDRRIDPLTRAFLLEIAGRRREDWTLLDLQRATAIVPTLTEMHIGTAVLSAFYEFLGLDPSSLFEPQLDSSWQATSTAFDPRNALNRRCANLRVRARLEPEAVMLNDLLNCGEQHP